MGLSGRENSVDEIFVRRDVIDSAKLRSLCVASDGAGAVQTLSHLGAIAVTGTLLWLWRGTWWAVPLFAVHGVLLNFLYAGQHELSHWTVFRTGWLNEWVGRVFGFVLFYPRTFDQIQHMAPLYPGLGAGRRAGARALYDDFLPAVDVGGDLLVHPLAPGPAVLGGSHHRALSAGQTPCRADSRSSMASCGLRIDRRNIRGRSQLGGGDCLAGAQAGDERRSPIAEHHRTSRSAARGQCAGQHAQHPHQQGYALAGLADAVSHGASCLFLVAVPSVACV